MQEHPDVYDHRQVGGPVGLQSNRSAIRAGPPAGPARIAEQVLKDPYNFDFLTVATAAREHEIERRPLLHLRDLLLELGRGFSFAGSQVLLEVGDQSFYPHRRIPGFRGYGRVR